MEEEAKSASFLQKLTKIKKSNKESKERTVLNQHKIEWHNKMKSYLKREKQLDDELEKFLRENPSLRVQSDCEQATKNVRERLKENKQKILDTDKMFESFDNTEIKALEWD